jgi:hypothetical protein
LGRFKISKNKVKKMKTKNLMKNKKNIKNKKKHSQQKLLARAARG